MTLPGFPGLRAPSPVAGLALLLAVGIFTGCGSGDPDGAGASAEASRSSGAEGSSVEGVPDASPGLPPGARIGPDGAPSFDELDQATLALLMESQELQSRVNALSDRVLEEPDLAGELEGLQARIDEVFRARNPDLVETMARYQAAYDEARAAGDREAQQRIQFEVAEVRDALAAAQQAVLADPEIAAAIEVFETRQRARVIERHPETEALFARLDELDQQIGAALGVPLR